MLKTFDDFAGDPLPCGTTQEYRTYLHRSMAFIEARKRPYSAVRQIAGTHAPGRMTSLPSGPWWQRSITHITIPPASQHREPGATSHSLSGIPCVVRRVDTLR